MNYLKLLSLGAMLAALPAQAQSLVTGGQFKDRIMPMQGSVTLETMKADNPDATIWGAAGVQNRYVDNGVEAEGLNIWGGNVYKDDAGTYHQFVAGWDGVNRPFSYWSNSDIYHFTSSTPYGPFTNPVNIGRGHNPEIFRAKDGTYVVYATIGNKSCWRHTSRSLGGPWTFEEMPYDLRDRALSTGSSTTYTNWTFARRDDGSQYCMDRGGAVWISKDGLDAFQQVLGSSCYPNGGGGTFEDPVVWRDEVQYHMIVNDWKARKAYYSRSADGFHWIAEDGLAYDIDISVHPDGTREEWYKYERPRVFQDKYGRAIQLNMAVIDVVKAEDVAGDNHSSKNIAMPLNPGLRLSVLNDSPITTSTQSIQVMVMAEDGFSPATDLDIESLRFGANSTVNKGGGAKVESSTADADGNLTLTFNGTDTGLTADEFAPKLIGRYAADYEMNLESGKNLRPAFCYGYARLPYYDYTPAYLSPVLPAIGEGSMVTSVQITNYGQSASSAGQTVKVSTSGGTVLATGTVPAIQPYETATVSLTATCTIPDGQSALVVTIGDGKARTASHTLLLTAISAVRATLAAKYNEALLLYNNTAYTNGREDMEKALAAARQCLSSYYEPEISAATDALQTAIETFRAANPDVANVSCRNYYLKAANISSGNIYVYVADDGTLARKNSYDETSVFTLVIDGDNDRTYLYNPSSKTFVVAKAGSNKSFWTTSGTDAYKLAKVESSTTTADAYTIMGDPTSTNAYNYFNAYGGANHTELSSYTRDDKNSQWLLVEAEDQTYTFDVTDVTGGLDDFLATARNINGATILPWPSAIGHVSASARPTDTPAYRLSGLRAADFSSKTASAGTGLKGIIIKNGAKYVVK